MSKPYAPRDVVSNSRSYPRYPYTTARQLLLKLSCAKSLQNICLVNEDFNHEKSDLLEENDALVAENVALRKEDDLYRAAEEMQIALRDKIERQQDALAAFALEGITGLFESGLGWDADCIEETALAYGLIFGEAYDPEGKHAINQCEIIEPGDTLLQNAALSKRAKRAE